MGIYSRMCELSSCCTGCYLCKDQQEVDRLGMSALCEGALEDASQHVIDTTRAVMSRGRITMARATANVTMPDFLGLFYCAFSVGFCGA